MTPQARVAAAIDILDQIAAGLPAEQALLRWSRGSRFAGWVTGLRCGIWCSTRCAAATALRPGAERAMAEG